VHVLVCARSVHQRVRARAAVGADRNCSPTARNDQRRLPTQRKVGSMQRRATITTIRIRSEKNRRGYDEVRRLFSEADYLPAWKKQSADLHLC